MLTFFFWTVAWIAACWIVARFCAFNRDECGDDERIESIRGELDVQEMKTKKVRAI